MNTHPQKNRENHQGRQSSLLPNILRAGVLALTMAVIMGSSSGCQDKKEAKVTTPPSYTALQQLFCLNVLSNISAHYNYHAGDTILDSTIYAVDAVLANSSIKQLIGNWKCVWGPGVLTSNFVLDTTGTIAANTMFIAQNIDTPGVYVVAIAGTDPSSAGDWIFEDADVLSYRYWEDVMVSLDTSTNSGSGFKPGKAFISKATNSGLVSIMNLRDTTQSDTSLISAAAFLQNLIDTATIHTTIWTTGHSLGGALAPTLALYLNDKWAINKSNVAIGCLAVAGATPGNLFFADHFREELASNFIRVWNQRDVVPHGYASQPIAPPPYIMQVDTIYSRDTITTPNASDINGMAVALAVYDYTQLQNSIYNSNKGFLSGFYSLPENMQNTKKFFTELAAQHIPAYGVYFKISTFQSNVQSVLGLPNPFFTQGFTPVPIVDPGTYPVLNSIVLSKSKSTKAK